MIINFGGCQDCRQGMGNNTSCENLVACSLVHLLVRLQITPPNFRTNPPESRFREVVEEREVGATSKNLQWLLQFLQTEIDWSQVAKGRNPRRCPVDLIFALKDTVGFKKTYNVIQTSFTIRSKHSIWFDIAPAERGLKLNYACHSWRVNTSQIAAGTWQRCLPTRI